MSVVKNSISLGQSGATSIIFWRYFSSPLLRWSITNGESRWIIVLSGSLKLVSKFMPSLRSCIVFVFLSFFLFFFFFLFYDTYSIYSRIPIVCCLCCSCCRKCRNGRRLGRRRAWRINGLHNTLQSTFYNIWLLICFRWWGRWSFLNYFLRHFFNWSHHFNVYGKYSNPFVSFFVIFSK